MRLWNILIGEPMFVDCQKIAGTWGRYFGGKWFVAFQSKTIRYFVTRLCGHKFVGKGTTRNSQSLNPYEQ